MHFQNYKKAGNTFSVIVLVKVPSEPIVMRVSINIVEINWNPILARTTSVPVIFIELFDKITVYFSISRRMCVDVCLLLSGPNRRPE